VRIAILGGGSWGTALAMVLARSHSIRLWVHDPDLCAHIRETRINDVYLPGFTLPPPVEPTNSLEEALDGAAIVLSVTPSQHCRALYARLRPLLAASQLLVSATKGIEDGTLLRMTEVIREAIGDRFAPRLGVLSGPTFAREIARGDPAAAVIAAEDAAVARTVQEAFRSASLRPYTNSDVPGVEYAGAFKNVIAIGAGICDGLGLGSNTMAALITRGLAEITRLACALGARRETLSGLAGMGDLVLTCTGALSRNRTLGGELARGRKLAEIVSAMRMVAEGVTTTRAALALARRAGVEMPITSQMHAVLFEGRPPREALRDLMERELKGE
jgi:glycerol-3-phosphate dehydrogenase (NAD(P)+)